MIFQQMERGVFSLIWKWNEEEDGISWAARKANGLVAWLDYMPVRGTTVGWLAAHGLASSACTSSSRQLAL